MNRVTSCLGMLSVFLPLALGAAESTVAVGSRLELFVDDFIVGELRGKAERRLHHPVPREIVLVTDKPWEGNHVEEG